MITIYKSLASLGLSDTEAQIYVFLAQQGPQNPEQIRAQLNIDSKQLATNIVSLREKGFVEVKTGQPNVFSIIPFDIVLQRLIDYKKEQISLLEKEGK